MSLVGFKGRNHRQQVKRNGARPEVDERGTPWELFRPLDERFSFTLDACALPHNAKCLRYFTPDDDGLERSWAGERVWCNPPYSSIEPWVVKASTSGAALVVMILPANRTEQGWWQRHIEPYRDRHVVCGFCGSEEFPYIPGSDDVAPGSANVVLRTEFLAGRRRFIAPSSDSVGPNERPPFGSVLAIWEDS